MISSEAVDLEPLELEQVRTGPRRMASFRMSKDDDSQGSFDTEVGVQESNHRAPCKRCCGTLCLTGPPEECMDLQKVSAAVYALVFIVYGSVTGAFMFEYYPGLVFVPLAYFLMNALAYFLCACTDPGVIPPKLELEDPHIPANVRVCRKCNIIQELDTRHCSFCNACVRELDHHCGVAGNCVGARNKLHFASLFFYYITSFWAAFLGILFAVLCHVLPDSEGRLPIALDICAIVVTCLLSIVLVVSIIVYILLYFGHLEKYSPQIFRWCCFSPFVRDQRNMLSTDLEREPLCCAGTVIGKQLTVPKRYFYPEL